jgi:hypothetical protein
LIAVKAEPLRLRNRFNGLFAVRGKRLKPLWASDLINFTAINRGVNGSPFCQT